MLGARVTRPSSGIGSVARRTSRRDHGYEKRQGWYGLKSGGPFAGDLESPRNLEEGLPLFGHGLLQRRTCPKGKGENSRTGGTMLEAIHAMVTEAQRQRVGFHGGDATQRGRVERRLIEEGAQPLKTLRQPESFASKSNTSPTGALRTSGRSKTGLCWSRSHLSRMTIQPRCRSPEVLRTLLIPEGIPRPFQRLLWERGASSFGGGARPRRRESWKPETLGLAGSEADKGDLVRRSTRRVHGDRNTRAVCNCHELRTPAPLGLSNFLAPRRSERSLHALPSPRPREDAREPPPRAESALVRRIALGQVVPGGAGAQDPQDAVEDPRVRGGARRFGN